MMSKNLNDYGLESSENFEVNQKTLRRILQIIARKKATFPSEVAQLMDAETSEIGHYLRVLNESGVIERLNADSFEPDARLVDRSIDLNKGRNDMQKPRWYGLNSDHGWALKVDGEKGPEYVNEYHLKTDSHPDKSLIGFSENKIQEYDKSVV
jgi:hypothetical protein